MDKGKKAIRTIGGICHTLAAVHPSAIPRRFGKPQIGRRFAVVAVVAAANFLPPHSRYPLMLMLTSITTTMILSTNKGYLARSRDDGRFYPDSRALLRCVAVISYCGHRLCGQPFVRFFITCSLIFDPDDESMNLKNEINLLLLLCFFFNWYWLGMF